MIFITVGTTIPFDDLLKEADRLAESGFFGEEEIVCQGGQSSYQLVNGIQFKTRDSIQDLIDQSSLVLSHGGLTIVQIMMSGKPFVCFPNLRAAGDHQSGFVRTIAGLADISWSLDTADMARLVKERRQKGVAQVHSEIPRAASLVRHLI